MGGMAEGYVHIHGRTPDYVCAPVPASRSGVGGCPTPDNDTGKGLCPHHMPVAVRVAVSMRPTVSSPVYAALPPAYRRAWTDKERSERTHNPQFGFKPLSANLRVSPVDRITHRTLKAHRPGGLHRTGLRRLREASQLIVVTPNHTGDEFPAFRKELRIGAGCHGRQMGRHGVFDKVSL